MNVHAFDSPVGDLLLTVHPLLRVLHGDKRERLQRAFVNTVLDMSSRALDLDQSRLPPNPKEAALALHRAVLELCLRSGVANTELVDAYNIFGETIPVAHQENVDASIERCLALLSLFHARRIETP